MTLRTRLIRVLRASPLPIGTGDLAAICAASAPHSVQQVNALLRLMERMGVVKRHPPIVRGEGRPANRWTLKARHRSEGRAA